jgi:hypothetical protein
MARDLKPSCQVPSFTPQLPAQPIAHSDNDDIHRNRDTLAEDEIVAGRVKNPDSLFFMIKG